MTLEDFVLTYKDAEGNVVCDIADYYERFIKPLDERFSRSSLHTHRTVICCFKNHADINPSMGTIYHRHMKGVKVYHCFGCGATGTIIRLHQRIQFEYYNRKLTDKESALELCKIYGIDASRYEEARENAPQDSFMDKLRRAELAMDKYTQIEFRDDIMKVRMHPELQLLEQAKLINSAMIKMTATVKDLID